MRVIDADAFAKWFEGWPSGKEFSAEYVIGLISEQ